MSKLEQTLSIIKPDAVERNLTEEIKSIFTKNNLIIKEDKVNLDLNDEIIKFTNLNLGASNE